MNLVELHRLLILAGAALLLVACVTEQAALPVRIDGVTMGTTYSIQLHELPAGIESDQLQNQLEELLVDITQQMSTYHPDSEITRFNQIHSTDWFEVSLEFAHLVAIAQQLSELSQGAFDITVGPLVELWGFGTRINAQRPTDAKIQKLMSSIGYGQLEWRHQPAALRKRAGDLQLDVSAIAKGYGVDVLAEYLTGLGVANYLVEIGGELRAAGINPGGEVWQIGILQPDTGTALANRVLALDNQAVATSGDYHNFYVENGRYYSHIIDPRTGYPVKHQTTSVTVVAASATEADAWATTLLVLGEEQGLQLAEQHAVAALFLIRQAGPGFRLVASSNMPDIVDEQ